MSVNDRILNERYNEWLVYFERLEEEKKLKEKNNKKQV